MSYQDVNPAGSSSAEGNSYNSGPTSGTESGWDNSGASSVADGFSSGNDRFEEQYGVNLDAIYPDPGPGSSTDENDETEQSASEDDNDQTGYGDEFEQEPQGDDDDSGDGGAEADANPEDDRKLSNEEWRKRRLNEIAAQRNEARAQRDEWAEPLRQVGISSPAQIPYLVTELTEAQNLFQEFGVSSARELRAMLDAHKQTGEFTGKVDEFVNNGQLDPEVAEWMKTTFTPVLQEAASARPLVQTFQQQQAETQFNNWVGGLKSQLRYMDEDAVRDAWQAGATADYLQQIAQRTHTRTENILRANRQQDVARGNVPKPPNAPKVETRSGGGAPVNVNAIPDPVKDPAGFDRYTERLLEAERARRGR